MSEYVSRWRIVAVVKDGKEFRERMVDTEEISISTARNFHKLIATYGFVDQGERVFPDKIESLQLVDLEKQENGE